jgi:LysR family tcuABC transcriptional regulator
MLNSRQLDLTILFDTQAARRWSVLPLVEEKLFLIQAKSGKTEAAKPAIRTRMADLKDIPLILPTGTHGLRSALDAAFVRAKFKPHLAAEIDSLAMTMAAVEAGLGSTVQPWAALATYTGLTDAAKRFSWAEIADTQVRRVNAICSLSDDELSPAALAARVVLADCARELVTSKQWLGVKLI